MRTRTQTLVGRYQLEEVVGRGGMSTVYRATDLMLGRTVAVKVLLAALAEEDPTYVARFEREARAAAGLTHRAVVTIYDAGSDDGERFIAMEYVEGRTLAALLRDEGPLEPGEAARIATEVAGALAAAHGAGILHRDIKPSNVMVTHEGAVKVLDFGIARPLNGTTLTQASSLVGTAAYMAPERALGNPGDARSDIYSLGCLLYAMLTGGPPFTGELSAAVLHQHVNTDPRPPSALAAGAPASLDALVLAMLAKEPGARPTTAAAVRDRLGALQAQSGARAPRPEVTAATLPLDRTEGTRVMASRQPGGAARRAGLAAVLTAAIALAAIALFGEGGSQNTSTSTHHAATTHSSPPPTTTVPFAPTTPAVTAKAPQPKKPKPAQPTGPPGHDKKHDEGHGGGEG